MPAKNPTAPDPIRSASPLPCPFCGKEPETFQSHRLAVRCSDEDCPAHGHNQYFWIELWNARTFEVHVTDVLKAGYRRAAEPEIDWKLAALILHDPSVDEAGKNRGAQEPGDYEVGERGYVETILRVAAKLGVVIRTVDYDHGYNDGKRDALLAAARPPAEASGERR